MTTKSTIKNRSLTFRIFAAFAIVITALTGSSFLVQHYPVFDNNPTYNHVITACLIAIITVLGVGILRSRVDKGTPTKIGLGNPSTAFKHVSIGIGLILIPLVLTLIISSVFNWADFSFNTNKTILLTFAMGLISTLFTDALTEELIFRGYIYSNLKVHYSVWKSSLIPLVIFVITPLVIFSIQNMLNLQGAVPLSGGYIVTMLLFGAFMQYLRVQYKSIWVGVGFHLVFVHMNQLMGTSSDKLLQFSETSNQQLVQITLSIFLIIAFLMLLIYPIVKRRRIKSQQGKV